MTATICDSGENDVTKTGNISIDASSTAGTYKITGLTKVGNYYVTLSKGDNKQTIKVSISKLSLTPVKVYAYWEDASTISSSKAGVLGGLALKADGETPESGLIVKAYNTKGKTWTTKTDKNGSYRFYLVPGTYTLVVTGDTESNKNVKASVKVVAGCMTGPLTDQVQTAWTEGENKLGYTKPTMSSDSKIVTGTVNAGCTVAIYEVKEGSPNTYTLLGTPVVANKLGSYTFKLIKYLPIDTSFIIRVTDLALNVYEDDGTALDKRSITLIASTTATINTIVVVGYADSANVTMTTNLTSMITSVSVKDADDSDVTLVLKNSLGETVTSLSKSSAANSDYSVAAGKITFKAGILGTAQTYKITVKATEYNSATLSQTVSASKTVAPTLAGTFTLAPGTTVGTTKFKAVGSIANTTDDIIVYKVSSAISAPVLEYKGNALIGYSKDSPNSVNVDAEITGIDSTTNKYIDLYEVNSSTGVIVSAKRLTVTATYILAPTFTSASASLSLLTLTSNASAIKASAIPAKTAFVVRCSGVANAVTSVAIDGKNVTLTLTKGIKDSDVITVAYTKPSSNYLQDTSGNAFASLSAKTLTVSGGNSGGGSSSETIPTAQFVAPPWGSTSLQDLDITYYLPNGSFNPETATDVSNWKVTKNGDELTVNSVSLSNENKTAYVVVSYAGLEVSSATILPVSLVFASGTAPSEPVAVQIISEPKVPSIDGVSLVDAPGNILNDYNGEGVLKNLPTLPSGYAYKYSMIPSLDWEYINRLPRFGAEVNGSEWLTVDLSTNVLDLSRAAGVSQSASAVNGIWLLLAQVDNQDRLVKYKTIQVFGITDYVGSTHGTLTGTVAITDKYVENLNPLSSDTRTFDVTVDGTSYTIVITFNDYTRGLLSMKITNAGNILVDYDSSGHIVLTSGSFGPDSKISVSGNDAALIFGTSPILVSGKDVG